MVRGAVVSFPSRPSVCVDMFGGPGRVEGGGRFGTFSSRADFLNEKIGLAKSLISQLYSRRNYSY